MRGSFVSLNRRVAKLYLLADEILSQGAVMPINKKSALSEYLISETWQAWNCFTKDIIIKSVQGCTARDGKSVVGRTGVCNAYWQLCYEASCHAKGCNIKPNGAARFQFYQAHTWGDSKNIISVVNGFNPSNKARLLSGFGAQTRIKDLQSVRNACAHKNKEIILDLRTQLVSKYRFKTIPHPSDYAWASTLNSNDIAYFLWVDEIKKAAAYVTESI